MTRSSFLTNWLLVSSLASLSQTWQEIFSKTRDRVSKSEEEYFPKTICLLHVGAPARPNSPTCAKSCHQYSNTVKGHGKCSQFAVIPAQRSKCSVFASSAVWAAQTDLVTRDGVRCPSCRAGPVAARCARTSM